LNAPNLPSSPLSKEPLKSLNWSSPKSTARGESVERDEGGEGRVRTLVVELLVVVLVVLLLVVVVLLVIVLLTVVCRGDKSQYRRLGCQRERDHHRSPSCRCLRGKGGNGQLMVRQRRKKQRTLLVVLVLVVIIVVVVCGRERPSTQEKGRGKKRTNSHACSACRRPCRRR
jgi:flagellar basal body-associated protein FliL